MEHKFQINLRGIIDLLSEHLYSGPEVFVRELLQNAVDAITARNQLDSKCAGDIRIECHAPKNKPPVVTFTDNGIGLTGEEVHKFLATIGLSSKKAADGSRPTDFIGQFGIGILACFVVSEEIVVITRSAKDNSAKPVEWRAKSDGTYTLKELDSEFDPGTQVWLTAKPGMEESFAVERVKELAKHFGGLLPYPIHIQAGKGEEVVNAGGAPWRRRYASEKERTKSLLAYGAEAFGGVQFFDAIPLASSVGNVDGVAFVLPFMPPLSARKNHRVYLKNMFLSDTADNLLPDWAFFVRAVVNANDLRPTASRESFHEDTRLGKVRAALGDCLRQYLVDLAENRPEKLERFIGLHHRALKSLAAEDDEFFAVIIDHLPFETSLGTMSFGEYRRENDKIRFVPDVDSFRQVAGVTAAQGLCVINAGYTYDAELLARAAEQFPDMTAEPLDPASVAQGFDDLSPDEEVAAEAFLAAADAVLRPFRVRAEAKKFRPDELPALYGSTRDARFFRSLEQSKEVSNPLWSGVLDSLGRRERAEAGVAQLCFNFRNPLVRKLAAVRDRKKLGRAVEMLYVQALLMGHHPLSSREMQVLNDGILALVEATTGD